METIYIFKIWWIICKLWLFFNIYWKYQKVCSINKKVIAVYFTSPKFWDTLYIIFLASPHSLTSFFSYTKPFSRRMLFMFICISIWVWITGTMTYLFSVKNVPNAFPLWGLMRKLDSKCEYDFLILFFRDEYVQFSKIGERYSREICSSFTLNTKYCRKM